MAIIKELADDFRFIFSYRKEKMGEQLALNKKAPKAGDRAPDFTLTDVNGEISVTKIPIWTRRLQVCGIG